jgi:hypothetical protein
VREKRVSRNRVRAVFIIPQSRSTLRGARRAFTNSSEAVLETQPTRFGGRARYLSHLLRARRDRASTELAADTGRSGSIRREWFVRDGVRVLARARTRHSNLVRTLVTPP